MPSNGNPGKPSPLRVVETLDRAVSKDAAGGSVAIPPGVEILDGKILYRERVPGPIGNGWIAGVAFGVAADIATVLCMMHGGWLIGIAVPISLLGTAVALTAFFFRELRIVVDLESIRWSFGPIARRYTLDEVSMFRERVFHFPRATGMGGWGIGKAIDGVDTYEVWGANGTAIDLVVRKNEVTSHYLVSTAAPDRLVVQLVRAMERRKAAPQA